MYLQFLPKTPILKPREKNVDQSHSTSLCKIVNSFSHLLQKIDDFVAIRKRMSYSELYVVIRPGRFIQEAFKRRNGAYDFRKLGYFLHNMIFAQTRPGVAVSRMEDHLDSFSFFVENTACPNVGGWNFPYLTFNGEGDYPRCSHDFLRFMSRDWASTMHVYSPVPDPNVSFENHFKRGTFLHLLGLCIRCSFSFYRRAVISGGRCSRTLRLRWLGSHSDSSSLLSKLLNYCGEHILKVTVAGGYADIKCCSSQAAYCLSKLIEDAAAFKKEFYGVLEAPKPENWPNWVTDEEDTQKFPKADAAAFQEFNDLVALYSKASNLEPHIPLSAAPNPGPMNELERRQTEAKNAARIQREKLKREGSNNSSEPTTAAPIEEPAKKRRKTSEIVEEEDMVIDN
jgi:hypothetical protein